MDEALTQIDILEMDRKIRSELDKMEVPDLETGMTIEERIESINRTLENGNLTDRARNALLKSRDDLEHQQVSNETESSSALYFYISETMELLQEYKSILNTPQKIDFMDSKNSSIKSTMKAKEKIIQKFLEIAKKYKPDCVPSIGDKIIFCLNCLNKNEFEMVEGSVHVCSKCFARQHILGHTSSYTDVDRINVSTKYMYDPRVHFRDCMNQYQGKQNCIVPLCVYQDLERQFRLHHLLVEDCDKLEESSRSRVNKNQKGYQRHLDGNHEERQEKRKGGDSSSSSKTKSEKKTRIGHEKKVDAGSKPGFDVGSISVVSIESMEDIPNDRFSKITKNQILLFLKELGYPKHYENVHLIHYNLTGKKPDDISHLEEKLLSDFDVLIDLYNKMYSNIKRKSFINTQYVLYQLLFRHKHPCRKEDFIVLKTIDLKAFHDDICKNLFSELGWNMSPYF